jgi:hypothetical protein
MRLDRLPPYAEDFIEKKVKDSFKRFLRDFSLDKKSPIDNKIYKWYPLESLMSLIEDALDKSHLVFEDDKDEE